MLVTNAKVFTGRDEHDLAEAFRIKDGVVSWVGAGADAPAPADGEPVLDLHGATVLPGLLDVHTHPAFMANLVGSVCCLPPSVRSLEQMLAAVAASPTVGRGPDTWIEAYGYDEASFPEGRHPHRRDLDAISTSQPVFVRRCCGHAAVVNSRALALAGVTRQTPDPPGGAFGRDEDGELNGRLIEPAATDVVADLIPAVAPDELQRRLAGLTTHFVERGIVGVGDLYATMIDAPLETFRAAEQLGWVPQAGLYLGWEHIKHAPPELSEDQRTGRVRIAGVKLFMDGAYSNRTAWTADAYPGTCTHGLRTTTDDDLRAAADWARRNRVQVAVHAMGDAALDHVIGMFEDEQPWLTDVPSIRLDHATLFSRARMQRIAEARMSFAVVSHTIFFFAEFDAYQDNLSPEQFRIAYPIRSFFEHVPATALSSDAPATAWDDADNVFVSIQAAVERRAHTGADIGQDEAVTVPQALLLYTSRAARTMSLDRLGQIAPGYEGSFVVLDRDVLTVAVADIASTHVTQTWVRGQRVHPAP